MKFFVADRLTFEMFALTNPVFLVLPIGPIGNVPGARFGYYYFENVRRLIDPNDRST